MMKQSTSTNGANAPERPCRLPRASFHSGSRTTDEPLGDPERCTASAGHDDGLEHVEQGHRGEREAEDEQEDVESHRRTTAERVG